MSRFGVVWLNPFQIGEQTLDKDKRRAYPDLVTATGALNKRGLGEDSLL